MPECHVSPPTTTSSALAAQIASTDKVRDVRISPDGSMILYQVQPFYKIYRATSELWLAHVDIADSGRRITNGSFNDRAGVFHPEGQKFLFLSDRHNPGGAASHIYVSPIDTTGEYRHDAEPVPLFRSAYFGPKGIQNFEISPDGQSVAFTSTDYEEPHPTEAKKVEEIKSDARVFGGSAGPKKERFARLRVFNSQSGETTTLEGVRQDRHIESYTWSPDSTRILYRLRQGRGPEFAEQEIVVESISIQDDIQTPRYLGTYPRSPSGPNLWVPGSIICLQNYEPRNILDARALFLHSPDESFSYTDNGVAGRKRMYGLTDDAVRMVDVGGGGVVAVEVASDVDTHIDVVDFTQCSETRITTVFRTQDEAIWFGAWDVKRVVDDDTNEVTYIVAVVLSSSIRHKPPSVYAIRITPDRPHNGQGRGTKLSAAPTRRLRVSSPRHLRWLSDLPFFETEVIRWQSSSSSGDSISLSGIVRYPPGYDRSQGPRPTILFIHGGPYRRDIPDYMPYFCNWREYFALSGYIVISPNYRGSQGRGHAFAHAASKGIGIHDWPDCESMVCEVVRRGLADPDRLGIAGWSHGGSLTAWGVTKTKNLFKAAIVGAGVSNWEGMVMDSGSPELEAEIGQSVPWDCDYCESETGGDSGKPVSMRKISPIHSVNGVTTAVLILHGEKDERVPVSQGIGFWRGLKRRAAKRGKEAAQLVLYPREPHGFTERKHAEDVLERVLSYLQIWI